MREPVPILEEDLKTRPRVVDAVVDIFGELLKETLREIAFLKLPQPENHMGRPTSLTDTIARDILTVLSQTGCSRAKAAASVGVDKAQLSRWITNEGEPYDTFRRLVLRAESYWRMRHEANANAGALLGNPELSLELLSRRVPEEWAKATVNTQNLNVNLNLTNILQRIEQQALAGPRDPRKPLPNEPTILDAIHSRGVYAVAEPHDTVLVPISREPVPIEEGETT